MAWRLKDWKLERIGLSLDPHFLEILDTEVERWLEYNDFEDIEYLEIRFGDYFRFNRRGQCHVVNRYAMYVNHADLENRDE